MPTTNRTLPFLPKLCRECTLQFAHSAAPEWASALPQHTLHITQTVIRNLERGRVHKILGLRSDTPLTPEVLRPYIQRVLRFHHQTHVFFELLRKHDEATWHQLSTELRQAALQRLMRSYERAAAQELADDHVQQLCKKLLSEPYPCDVSFEAWSRLILVNELRQDLRRKEAQHESLDDEQRLGLYQTMTDDAFVGQVQRFENLHDLLVALAPLSGLYRYVLMATYFDGLTDSEIAKQLGRTVKAVRNVRHRALVSLRNNFFAAQPSAGVGH